MKSRFKEYAVGSLPLLITLMAVLFPLLSTTSQSAVVRFAAAAPPVVVSSTPLTVPPSHMSVVPDRRIVAQVSRSYNRFATTPTAPAIHASVLKVPVASVSGSGAEAFRQCVFMRESTDNYRSPGGGGYGIIDLTWQGHDASHPLSYAVQYGVTHAYLATPVEQDAAFWDLYRRDGVSPWRRYDGC